MNENRGQFGHNFIVKIGLFIVLCSMNCLNSVNASVEDMPVFSVSLKKGYYLHENAFLPTDILSTAYRGSSLVDFTSDRQARAYYFESPLRITHDVQEFGLEFRYALGNAWHLFLGLSGSDFSINENQGTVTFPIRIYNDTRANYSRRVQLDNGYYSLGVEKQLFSLSGKWIVQWRGALQLIRSSLTDTHRFQFENPLAGEVRTWKYFLYSNNRLAAEMGLDTTFAFTRHANLSLFAGYLLDISKKSYELEKTQHNFLESDNLVTVDPVWLIYKNKTMLSDGNNNMHATNTDFSSWHISARISLVF